GARRCGPKQPDTCSRERDSSERPLAARALAPRSRRQPGQRELRLAGRGTRTRIDAQAGHEDGYAVPADDRTVAKRRRDAARLELELEAARRTACAGLEAVTGRARSQLEARRRRGSDPT